MKSLSELIMTRWYERHPLATMILVVASFILLADLLAGLMLIKEDFNSYRTPHPVYHHDLIPGMSAKGKWGVREYEVFTNSLGFRDGRVRDVALQSKRDRILLIGDSFTEGIGVPWNESFAGILDSTLAHQNIEVLNAATVSYSPKFYYAKVRFLLEEKKLQFSSLYVLVDNSDPMNEITYQNFRPYHKNSLKWYSLKSGSFLYRHSFIYHSVKTILNRNRENPVTSNWNRKMGAAVTDETAFESNEFLAAIPFWSFDKKLYMKWGEKGLSQAAIYMKKLANLCRKNNIRMTVVIYPWPPMIQDSDLDNIQVNFWKNFCVENQVRFLDLYPAFITGEDPVGILNRYFIPGDVHWNHRGHRLVAGRILSDMGNLTDSSLER